MLTWSGSIAWIDKATSGVPRDETLFIEAIINSISSNYSVDLNRIYACGYSEGGVFSYELYELNNKIAGIASVSGSMLSESERSNLGFKLFSQHPTAIMLIPGTSDTNPLLYQGCCLDWGLDSYYLSVNQITDYWTNYNSPKLIHQFWMYQTQILQMEVLFNENMVKWTGGVEVQELKDYRIGLNGLEHLVIWM